MIGQLTGQLIVKTPPDLVLDVGGVGYEVQAPMTTFYQLPNVGHAITLYTHFVVREDAQLIYGFHTISLRRLFRTLIRVNNVGPKLALAILSSMEADHFVRCVVEDDIPSLTRIPGVGKKTAERLLVEMRDRLSQWQQSGDISLPELIQPTVITAMNTPQPQDEAVNALIALGYKLPEAERAVKSVATEGMDSEALIRAALKSRVAGGR